MYIPKVDYKEYRFMGFTVVTGTWQTLSRPELKIDVGQIT